MYVVLRDFDCACMIDIVLFCVYKYMHVYDSILCAYVTYTL